MKVDLFALYLKDFKIYLNDIANIFFIFQGNSAFVSDTFMIFYTVINVC